MTKEELKAFNDALFLVSGALLACEEGSEAEKILANTSLYLATIRYPDNALEASRRAALSCIGIPFLEIVNAYKNFTTPKG